MHGDGPIWELYPSVAAIASVYGDPDGKYAEFLKGVDLAYPAEPYFFWDQPLSDLGLAVLPPPSETATALATASMVGGSGEAGRVLVGWSGRCWGFMWMVSLMVCGLLV